MLKQTIEAQESYSKLVLLTSFRRYKIVRRFRCQNDTPRSNLPNHIHHIFSSALLRVIVRRAVHFPSKKLLKTHHFATNFPYFGSSRHALHKVGIVCTGAMFFSEKKANENRLLTTQCLDEDEHTAAILRRVQKRRKKTVQAKI